VLPAVAALGTAALPEGTPLTLWHWATLCAICWVAVGVIGLVQLVVAVVRQMPAG
jgi:hypothetical protein